MNTATSDRRSSADPRRRDDLRRLLQKYYEGKHQLRRGLCLLAAGRYDQAIRALDVAAKANPQSLSLSTYLAAAYVGKGRFGRAAAHFQKNISREPANVLHRVRHALALWKAGRSDRAIASLREGISHNLESAELHFQLGTVLASADQTEEAELRFTQAIAINKHHAEAMVELGLCYGARGDVREAVCWLKRAQTHDPGDARTALLLTHAVKAAEGTEGEALPVTMPPETTVENDTAIDELSSTIESEPGFVEAFLSLDPKEVNAEVFAVLATTINRALERCPEHADLHYHCGCVLDRLGRTRDAITSVERAVKLRPRFIKALIQLARLYRQTNRHADACRRLEDAIRLGAEYADVYCTLGNLYRDSGMVERAREAYRRALRINPQYAEAEHALQTVTP